MPPEQRDSFDFAVFNNFDGISDEPITQFFPYIMRAYPNAKVILTTRNTTDWVRSRQKNHPMSPLPFTFLTRSIDAIYKLTVHDPQTHLNISRNQFTKDTADSGSAGGGGDGNGVVSQAISGGDDPNDLVWLRPNMKNLGVSA